MAPAPRFWDRIARKYAATPVRDEAAYARTLARTRAYLSPEARVLELGCGTGSTALTLAPEVASYTASDFSGTMLEIAREKAGADGPSSPIFIEAPVESDALDTAADGAPFDAILAFSLIHLLPDPSAAIRRAFDRLAPGGHFISKTVCLGDGGLLYRIVLPLMRLVGKAPPVAFLKGDVLTETIRSAGFEILESDDHNTSPSCRFIVARKPLT